MKYIGRKFKSAYKEIDKRRRLIKLKKEMDDHKHW